MTIHSTYVDRLSPPRADAFERDYLIPQRPAILTGLFADQPLGQIVSRERRSAKLANARIVIAEEYTRSLLANSFQTPSTNQQIVSLGEYLEFVDANPRTRDGCARRCIHPTTCASCLVSPIIASCRDCRSDAKSMLFFGERGKLRTSTFRRRLSAGASLSVFGHKRIILIPPSEGYKLLAVGNFGLTCFEHFTESEITEYLQCVKGFQCTLNPGEAIFIPAAFWHFVGYLTTGMSVNVRFGRNEFTQFLGDNCHANCYLQCLAAEMIDRAAVEGSDLLDDFREIQRTYSLPYQTAQRRVGSWRASVGRFACDGIRTFARCSQIQLPSPVHDGFLKQQSDRLYPVVAPQLAGWGHLLK